MCLLLPSHAVIHRPTTVCVCVLSFFCVPWFVRFVSQREEIHFNKLLVVNSISCKMKTLRVCHLVASSRRHRQNVPRVPFAVCFLQLCGCCSHSVFVWRQRRPHRAPPLRSPATACAVVWLIDDAMHDISLLVLACLFFHASGNTPRPHWYRNYKSGVFGTFSRFAILFSVFFFNISYYIYVYFCVPAVAAIHLHHHHKLV